MSKQDRQGVRTAADLERKHAWGKQFAEILGIITDTRESVEGYRSELSHEIKEQVTWIVRNTEEILLGALESYSKTSDLDSFKKAVSSEMSIMAENISMSFDQSIEYTKEVDGELQTVVEEMEKHFEFTINGLVIKAGENDMKLLLDNDTISFYKGEIDFDNPAVNRRGYWDGDSFHIGNIYIDVDEIAQFGNYGFVPYDDGTSDGLDLVRVGE